MKQKHRSRILVIDDDALTHQLIRESLGQEGYLLEDVNSAEEGLKKLNAASVDLILLDYQLPEMNGLDFLRRLKSEAVGRDFQVILMTAHGNLNIGLEAIEKGCFDFIEKPLRFNDLNFRIVRALSQNRPLAESGTGDSIPEILFSRIIGNSPALQKVFRIISHVAEQDATVLIEGETGTGKELFARAIHDLSKRKEQVFIPVNCGAIAENLLESELFGYEKGAFTGANAKKFGILEAASEGTIFLDEINSASPGAQAKLLRFIEYGQFMRVGGNELITSKARVVTASNQDLEFLAKEKKFREDLYHRLNVVKIRIPNLRERKEDIPVLIEYFLAHFGQKFGKNVRLLKPVLQCLSAYSWPGNVRQLMNTVQSLVLLNENGSVRPGDLPKEIFEEGMAPPLCGKFKVLKEELIRDFETKYFKVLLTDTRGNITKAATLSGLNRKTLTEKLTELGFDASLFKDSIRS